jgi:general stress protein YciG
MAQKMTRSEAGRLGGLRTAQKHGSEFYARIGRKGGSVSSGNFRSNPGRARRAGRRGGQNSRSDL